MKTLLKKTPILKNKGSAQAGRRRAAPPKTYIKVQVDSNLKKEVDGLFSNLGLDTPTAIRIFLAQAVRSHGLPFEVNQFNAETLEALEEAERISRDPNAKSYTNVDEMMREILQKTKTTHSRAAGRVIGNATSRRIGC